MKNMLLGMLGAASIAMGAGLWSTSATAQPAAVEAEIIGFHQLCNKGDRRACVRFGMLLERSREHHALWRKAHADWFWWDR